MKRFVKLDCGLTAADKAVLRLYSTHPKLLKALEKISDSVIASSVTARTVEGLVARDEWRRCIGFIKKMMISDVKINVDSRTGKIIK